MDALVDVCGGDCPWGDIADLLRSSFSTFRDWGLTGGDLEEYRRLDPAVARGFHVVAAADGLAVSHVQVVVRRLLFAGVAIPVCGIANVATRPEWRGRGLATRLLSTALAECRARGIPLAGLYTGFLSDAYRVYRRLGFRDVAAETVYGAPTGEAVLPAVGGVEVRPLAPRDAAEAARLYGEASRSWGLVTAMREAFAERVFEKRFYHTFFYDEPERGVALAAVVDGELAGYALAYHGGSLSRPYGDGSTGQIYELVAKSPGALRSLYGAAVEELARLGARGVWLHAPPTPFYAEATGWMWRAGGGGTYMAAVIDGEVLSRLLAAALTRRMEETGVCGEGSVVLRAGHRIGFAVRGCEAEASEAGPTIHMGEVNLLRLIHGEAALSRLIASGRAVPHGVPGSVVAVLDEAFRGGLYVWPMDHW